MNVLWKYQSTTPAARSKVASKEAYVSVAAQGNFASAFLKAIKSKKRKRRGVYVKQQSMPIVANPRYRKIGDTTASTVGGGERLRIQPPREWFGNSGVILSKLLDTQASAYERRAAVLFSSVTTFEDSEKGQLLQGLARYIEKSRFAEEESVLTVLGAAVRKYCMNMPDCLFDSTSAWFSPSETQAVSPIFEMELSKGIHWRLTSMATRDEIAAPKLLEALEAASRPYLYASRLVRSETAAVAMNLCIATLELGARTGEDERMTSFVQQMKVAENARLLAMVSRQLERDARQVREQSLEFSEKLKQLATF